MINLTIFTPNNQDDISNNSNLAPLTTGIEPTPWHESETVLKGIGITAGLLAVNALAWIVDELIHN